jgi:uncharacterized protein
MQQEDPHGIVVQEQVPVTDGETTAIQVAPLPQPPAAPPAGDFERIGALDLIRGVAILGILAANIPWFSGTGPPLGPSPPGATVADQVVKGLTIAFVDVKFITQLAILFGAGLTLQADRAWGAGRRFTWGYLWRTFLLLLLGVAHGVLLWWGDILMMYACISVAAVLFVRLRRVGLLVVMGFGLTWTAACITTFLTLGLVFNQAGERDKPPPRADATQASLTEAFSQAVHGSPEEREKRWKRAGEELRVFMSRDNQVRIYREGPWSEQLFDRVVKVVFLPKSMFIIGAQLLACFLFGAFLVRAGFFADPEVYRRWRGWLLGGGLMLGVPMHVASLILVFGGGKYSFLAVAPHLCGAIGIAVVYLTLLTGWAQTNRAVWLRDRLAAVGRLALTNYLMQTVICTTIFYSFGFGLYGSLGRPATWLVVLGVWLLQLLLSPLYLKVFRIGPVEWLWRSLAHGRLQPVLQKA